MGCDFPETCKDGQVLVQHMSSRKYYITDKLRYMHNTEDMTRKEDFRLLRKVRAKRDIGERYESEL